MAARTRLLPLFLVALLAVACTAGSSPSAEISLEPSPSEALESEPVPSESTTPPCDPGFVCSGDLLPGEYRSTSTGVTITFTLAGEGWSGLQDSPGDGFALFNDAVAGPHGISVVSYSGEVFSEVCSPEPTEMIGTKAVDLIVFLSVVEGVQAEEPVDMLVGGLPAIRLDLTTVSPCNDPDVGDRMWLWTLPTSGDFHFNDAERVRVYAVDAGNVVVAIVIEGFPDVVGPDADYDVLLQKAEEVIATMTIAPPL